MDYDSLKLIHQLTATLSITGFMARGIGIGLNASWPTGRLAKTLPHINDSVLLFSALSLAWAIQATPGNSPWLLAKVTGLLVYIGLGVIAIRPGRSLRVRAGAWFSALLVFAYIVSVATTKSPAGYLSPLF